MTKKQAYSFRDKPWFVKTQKVTFEDGQKGWVVSIIDPNIDGWRPAYSSFQALQAWAKDNEE